jgi:phenylacetate-CoA ligase
MTGRLERLGARAPRVSVSYAATELQVGTVECAPGSGYHNPAPDEFMFEVVDEDGRPVPEGARGRVVATHLNRRGTVLARYLLGDESRITTEPCPHCGATTERFVETPRRADDLLKIRGMLVDPAALSGVLAGLDLAEWQAVIGRERADDPLSMDRLTIRAAPAGAAASEALAARIAEAVKAAVGVRPEVAFAAPSEIWDPDRSLKSRRIVDDRARD